MARLVAAFAGDAAPAVPRANLVIVGGDLAAPNLDERAELDRIPWPRLPTRPAHQLTTKSCSAIVRTVRSGTCSPRHGAVFRASRRQRAPMPARARRKSSVSRSSRLSPPACLSLPPEAGGPSTYVEDGCTGILVDTSARRARAGNARRTRPRPGPRPGGARAVRDARGLRHRRDGRDSGLRRCDLDRRTRAARVVTPRDQSRLRLACAAAVDDRRAWQVAVNGSSLRPVRRSPRSSPVRDSSSHGLRWVVDRMPASPPREPATRRGRQPARVLRGHPPRHGRNAPLSGGAARADLLWDPVATVRRTLESSTRSSRHDPCRPRRVRRDGRLRSPGSHVPTSSSGTRPQLPVAGETFGVPTAWPTAFHPDPAALAALRDLADDVATRFTSHYDDALRSLTPTPPRAWTRRGPRSAGPAQLSRSAPWASPHLRAPSSTRLPGLRDPARTAGRRPTRGWIATRRCRSMVVSFGTFLSARNDVLAQVADALRGLDARVAIATGTPASAQPWGAPGLARPATLPQVALLGEASPS